MIADHLHSNGVDALVGGSLPTSTAVASLDATGAAEYTFSISWDINGASIPALAAVESSIHVHTGSIASVLTPGNKSVRRLIEVARPHATVSFDPNCRPAISQDAAGARYQAEDLVAASDIVKASDEDLRWLYPDRTLDESITAWLELGPAFKGNAYESDVQRFPHALRDAIAALEKGNMVRKAFGDDVVDHYLNYARTEQEQFDKVVTGYERERLYERG
jgi:sugar/nucleoside kinase (ribokinase family)